ncbi:MAG TPA: hypothetical protein VHX49_14850 [Candidatus Acidoferrales bacterium]|nr:hypothetical protein [Candidatus Acidoferrales bacterium]
MMPHRFMDARFALPFLACALSLAVTGCNGNSVHAAVPATAPSPASAQLDRPMTTAPDTDATPPLEATAVPPPSIPAPPATSAPVSIPATRQPVPTPRRPSEAPAGEGAESAARQPALQITPELSPGDEASYERRTADDLAIADKNLGQASGKQLSAAQMDLVAKITSFASQSRDASKSGDWARAQNLAQKARLLSDELLNSL